MEENRDFFPRKILYDRFLFCFILILNFCRVVLCLTKNQTSHGWFEVFQFSRSVAVQLVCGRCHLLPEKGVLLKLVEVLSKRCPILNQLSVYKIYLISNLGVLCTCNILSSCNFNPSLIQIRGMTTIKHIFLNSFYRQKFHVVILSSK